MLDLWSDLVRHTGLEGVDAFNENKIMKRLRYCVDEAVRELPSVQSAQGMYESFPIVASFFGRKGLFPLQFIQEKMVETAVRRLQSKGNGQLSFLVGKHLCFQ